MVTRYASHTFRVAVNIQMKGRIDMITSVISEKGGVGKSTCAVNIAKALTRKGRKVLVIDLDGQANASKALGALRNNFCKIEK